MKKFIVTFSFMLFFSFNYNLAFGQTAENTEEITVFKKANPNYQKDETKINALVTTEKMQNPDKKKDSAEENNLIITEQKSRNPKSPK